MGALEDQCKIVRHSDPVAVGTTLITPTNGIDMSGYQGCMFIVHYGTITDGTNFLKVQQSSDDGSADAYADLEGTKVSAAVGDDDKDMVVDVWRPRERYLKCLVSRGGSTGAVINGITAILYGARSRPQAHSGLAAHEHHAEPAEGTA